MEQSKFDLGPKHGCWRHSSSTNWKVLGNMMKQLRKPRKKYNAISPVFARITANFCKLQSIWTDYSNYFIIEHQWVIVMNRSLDSGFIISLWEKSGNGSFVQVPTGFPRSDQWEPEYFFAKILHSLNQIAVEKQVNWNHWEAMK